MRFLIVASILACAAAGPSGLLASPYHSVLAPAVPTISAGDINGAAIEAHVEASDHVRAAYDAGRQVQDKVNELHGQAINNAQESAWRAVDHVKTVEARLDGAAASAAPVLSKQLVGRVAPAVSYAAPAVASYAAPAVASYAAPAVASYAAPAVASYAAPAVASYAAPAVETYAAPAIASYAPAVAESYSAPIVAAPYSEYPANVVSPYYGSPLGYPAW